MELTELTNEAYRKLAKKYRVEPISQTQGIRKCDRCQDEYVVKFADLKRGWGKNCSKSCAAISNDNGSRRTGAFRASDFDPSWDGHKHH